MTMEDLLKHICEKKMLAFEDFSLKIPDSDAVVEVDRPLGYYMQQNNLTSICVVKATQKVYSNLIVSENGQDVMILHKEGSKYSL